MVDKDPQDTEILDVINSAGGDGIDPQALIDVLTGRDYEMPAVIEALQRAIERSKISLSSDGMVVALHELADAA
jgi:hypothetical protein